MSSKKDNYKFLRSILRLESLFAVFLLVIGAILIITPAIPAIWYNINSNATTEEIDNINSVVKAAEEDKQDFVDPLPAPDPLPPFDSSLPKENRIIISKIGVDSPIYQGSNGAKELEKGPWLTYGWGTPDNQELQTIIAAHRFGYVYWSADFRRTQSFFNLPKLVDGDKVEIIWEQRKYEYQVVATDRNTKITNFDADLTLYTCEMFNSPVRIFKYLDRVLND